ncbi:MAG: hypothetical protein AAFW69_01095 [Pseudomonadota bacterium]
MAEPRLTIFFVVEPPKYQNMACYLAASVRCHFDEPVAMVGYCPANRMEDLEPRALRAFEMLDVDIRPMETDGRFDPPYPHGNKMLAALEPRETPFSAFMDSDMVFIAANTSEAMVKEGHVSVAPSTSMYWSGQEIWKDIYAACDMEMPEERIWLLRQRRRPMMPYFNAGLIVFPEGPVAEDGRSFPRVWNDLAQRIDRIDVVKKRPYLDQMSLPLAIRAAGLDWNILPEEQHYILGGAIRGEPLPEDRDIKLVHYRNMTLLKEVGYLRKAKGMLQRTVGVRRLDKIEVEGGDADG